MNKEEWKERIIAKAKEAGTYRDCFADAIDTLSSILERRDDAEAQFVKSGGRATVTHTNKGGNANTVKNPALTIIDDMNKTALMYWRDLGLTPAGLKRIKDFKVSDKPKSALERALEELAKD